MKMNNLCMICIAYRSEIYVLKITIFCSRDVGVSRDGFVSKTMNRSVSRESIELLGQLKNQEPVIKGWNGHMFRLLCLFAQVPLNWIPPCLHLDHSSSWHLCPCQTVHCSEAPNILINFERSFSNRIWNKNKRSNICYCKLLQMFACTNIKVSLSTSERHLTLFRRGQVHSDKGKARQMPSSAEPETHIQLVQI